MTTATATDTTTCLDCGIAISDEAAHYGFGRCYSCQCAAHAMGEIDMDATDGIADTYREDFGDEPDCTEDDLAVMRGDACYVTDSPTWQHARECERLVEGVHVMLTINSDLSWDIPF